MSLNDSRKTDFFGWIILKTLFIQKKINSQENLLIQKQLTSKKFLRTICQALFFVLKEYNVSQFGFGIPLYSSKSVQITVQQWKKRKRRFNIEAVAEFTNNIDVYRVLERWFFEKFLNERQTPLIINASKVDNSILLNLRAAKVTLKSNWQSKLSDIGKRFSMNFYYTWKKSYTAQTHRHASGKTMAAAFPTLVQFCWICLATHILLWVRHELRFLAGLIEDSFTTYHTIDSGALVFLNEQIQYEVCLDYMFINEALVLYHCLCWQKCFCW